MWIHLYVDFFCPSVPPSWSQPIRNFGCLIVDVKSGEGGLIVSYRRFSTALGVSAPKFCVVGMGQACGFSVLGLQKMV